MSSPLLADATPAAVRHDVTVLKILGISAPAILNNVAAPLAAAVQLAILGHAGNASTAKHNVAVFTPINAIATFVVGIANFVIVVTMARVSHALGAKQWGLLGQMVRAVLAVALVIGCACAGALRLARTPLLSALSLTSAEEGGIASAFLPAALLRVPPLLVLRAASSVLCGYQRVRAASLLNVLLAAVDCVAFYVALIVLELDLRAAGLAVAATCTAAAALALLAVFGLPPDRSVRVCCCTGEGPHAIDGSAASLASLACDSLNVLIRSLCLSGSVLALTVATTRLDNATDSLNAHAVVLQLWMITSYVVDGFADAGTMLGAKLLGAGDVRQMRWLTTVLCVLGLGTGVAAGVLLAVLRDPLITVFTRNTATIELLRGPLWVVLCVLQPINALVFVYDGLLYATRSFRYVRNALLIGALAIFAPALGAAVCVHTLLAIWIAKAALNVWRCVTALVRIHCMLKLHWTCNSSTTPTIAPTGPLLAVAGCGQAPAASPEPAASSSCAPSTPANAARAAEPSSPFVESDFAEAN